MLLTRNRQSIQRRLNTDQPIRPIIHTRQQHHESTTSTARNWMDKLLQGKKCPTHGSLYRITTRTIQKTNKTQHNGLRRLLPRYGTGYCCCGKTESKTSMVETTYNNTTTHGKTYSRGHNNYIPNYPSTTTKTKIFSPSQLHIGNRQQTKQ